MISAMPMSSKQGPGRIDDAFAVFCGFLLTHAH
jgi:hypothetical protein